jgi:alkylation response protein AidB-like acyl-CoA dehydrogenase
MSESPHLALRAVLSEIVPAHRDRWGESTEWEALVAFQRTLGARGWAAPGWPVAIGGLGLSVEEQVACDAELTRANAPRSVASFGVKNVGPTIAVTGTAEQKQHLARILSAEEVWCQGFSEPDFGSDLAGLQCRAEVSADEEGFTITGSKVWTSIGVWATHCMLLVRTDPNAPKHRGISALLIPLDLPGITRRPIVQLNRQSGFAEMHFDGVRAPRSALLGPLNEGWRVTMTTLAFERGGVVSLAGRLAEDVRRVVAPEILGALSPVDRQEAMRLYSASYMLTWMGERAKTDVGPDGTPGPLSSLIKLAWSVLGVRLGEFAVDSIGVAAVAGAHPDAADQFLASRAMTIAGGTTEVLKNLIGERALGLPKEPSGTRLG